MEKNKYFEKESTENNTVAEITEADEIIERPYTLRKLQDGDLFPFLQLIRKCGLKELKEALTQKTKDETTHEVGAKVMFDIVDKLIENINGDVGDEIYAFWSKLSDIPTEEIKKMEFGTLPLMIYDSFAEVKNTSFFKVLSKLL